MKGKSTTVRLRHLAWSVALGLVICGGNAYGQDADDLTDLSLEELLDIEITSVSKKSERRTQAAAAVFVISAEDIERSGAQTIPDVLRGVPGISVARLDANKWSVASRGFGGIFANKLLVLVDGVSVYTPLFSGVYWDKIGIPMEDIDRIEVIRGPGSTVWGANAVNGVINIVTKSSADTQGGLFSIAAGNELEGDATLRWGFPAGDKITGRFYTRYMSHDHARDIDGSDANDGWWHSDAGVRFDWNATDEDLFTFQGGWFDSSLEEEITLASVVPPTSRIRTTESNRNGNYILGRWTHTMSDESSWQLQLYYNHWEEANVRTISETRDTFDIDFQHRFALGDRHDIVWGAGFRYIADDIESTRWLYFDPGERADQLYSAFIQDEISLIEDRLALTLGAKFEHNSYTGFEVQPSARLAWTPNEQNTVWASVSRAVRTPSRSESDTLLPNIGLPGAMVTLVGSEDYDSEELWAFELGYRVSPRDDLLFDIALFYNDYDDLRSIELSTPEFGLLPGYVPHLRIPFIARNNTVAQTYGIEIAADWRPVDWWRTHLSYSYLNVDFDVNDRAFDIISGLQEGDSPEHQIHWSNYFQVTDDVELSFTLRYVDELSTLGVDDYFTADARVAWQIRENMKLSILGQNLFDSERAEFAPTFVNTLATETELSVFGKFTWTF